MGLEMVEITMEVEERFSVDVPQARLSECCTYGDLLDLVVDLVEKSNSSSSESEIDSFLRKLFISDYLIKAEHITRDAKLYGPNLNLG